ncbi:nitrogen assimilation transcription factor nit-4 [Podospora fimiseda]|uniref:Nitrogen assimilation transcription factor nit-4 n=1 Tax=Podospora fimiseda TaxID=252190 RepID=A0AAN7H3V1_9PEZI|nr:nitrogen assimilation transcription factor nit-4 [Podospora fimiseda]
MDADPIDEDTAHNPTITSPTTGGHNNSSSAATPSSASGGGAAASTTVLAGGGVSKRRRGLGVVTPNACTECRKKRAKCDGQRPCGRCKVQKDVECIYEIPVRQSKENLRNELEQLRRQQRSNDQVISALVRSDYWEEVLQRLRSGHSVETVSEWLGVTLPSGSGALPPISRIVGSAASAHSGGLGFIGAFPGPSSGYAPIQPGPGFGTTSPASSHSHFGIRHDNDHTSHWGGPYSATTQSHTPRSSSYPDIMNWSSNDTLRPLPALHSSRVGSWVESQGAGPSRIKRFNSLENVLVPEHPGARIQTSTWTDITSDPGLVQHLLALYFCWEYPTFASLSKEHFLRDFADSRPRFCSSILVNALLALGCRFSSKPNTRAHPNDPYSSGDHFFKECQRLLQQEDNHHKLTTIQALGIMSIREASCGRDSESWYYAGQSIRLAIEMGLHRIQDDGKDDDESAVQAATFWGAFALDHAWSLATGSLPQSSVFLRVPPKPAIIDDIEASLWIPYTDDGKGVAIRTIPPEFRLNNPPGAPLQRSCEQPSNVRSVYKCFCELSELVHQSLYVLHSPGRPLTSKDLLDTYTQYLNWYERIPEVLRLGHNFTPAVLFAHMYYHFAILLLFRPLIKLRIIGSSISPRDVCSQAADAISGLLRSYSQLYTLRRTPSFVPYFVLTSSIMHLAISTTRTNPPPGSGPNSASTASSTPAAQGEIDPNVTDAISRGIADLTEMAPCHHFAEQALNILKYLAKKWNIDIEIKTAPGEGPPPAEPDNVADTTRPLTSSLNFFAPNFDDSYFNCEWPVKTRKESGTDMSSESVSESFSTEKADRLADDPLFWPFPMQGRPILASGKALEEAGFVRI